MNEEIAEVQCVCDDGYSAVGAYCVPIKSEPEDAEPVEDHRPLGLLEREDGVGPYFEESLPLFGALPAKVDIRAAYLDQYAPVISDQLNCGWCVAHATTHHTEAIQAQKRQTAVAVSEPHLWYVGGQDIKDCAGGWWNFAAFAAAAESILLKESFWPYFPDKTRETVPPSTTLAHADVSCRSVSSVNRGGNSLYSDKLKSALAAGNTVVIGVDVYFSSEGGMGLWAQSSQAPIGLPKYPNNRLAGGHAILVTGYDDNDSGGTFTFRNSWGANWQDGGYGRLTYSFVDKYGRDGHYFSNCSVGCVPSSEKCDGKDNDCDGKTDEGLVKPCGTDVGACVSGQMTCSKGKWGSCKGAVSPVREVCNSEDDDCDGVADEDVVQSCGSAVGECVPGHQMCSDGSWGECIGEWDSRAEVCDALDNDCDGVTDNGLNRECGSDEGECRKGVQTCESGDWGDCVGSVSPVSEICDNKDNDCDGATDEDVLDKPTVNRCPTRGACSWGAADNVCVEGNWVCSFPPDYVATECAIVNTGCGTGADNDLTCVDGLDNDCDGVTDENNVYDVCSELPDYWKIEQGIECFHGNKGQCLLGGGTYECVQLGGDCGVSLSCQGGVGIENETCDGLDHDCDGFVYDRNDEDGDGFGDCADMPTFTDCAPTDPDVGSCDDGDDCTIDACSFGSCEHELVCWKDPTTGLIWQEPIQMNPRTQLEAQFYCENITRNGFSDWRLPTLAELRSLVRGYRAIMSDGQCKLTDSCADFTKASCFSEQYCSIDEQRCFLGPADYGFYWDLSLSGSTPPDYNGNLWSSAKGVMNSATSGNYDVNIYIDFGCGSIVGYPADRGEECRYEPQTGDCGGNPLLARCVRGEMKLQ